METAPYLRNYGLVNALWMGVFKFWSAVPHDLRPRLADHKVPNKLNKPTSLAADNVISQLLEYWNKDYSTLCNKKLSADVKLIQFWTVQISKLLAAYPENALLVAASASMWIQVGRFQLAEIENMSAGSNSIETTAIAEFIRAVHEGSLWARATRLFRQAVSLMPVAERAPWLKELSEHLRAFRMTSNMSVSMFRGEYVFPILVELLGHAGSMPTNPRSDFFPLFKEVMLCVSGANFAPALCTAELRQNTADLLTAFILSLASAATGEEVTEGAREDWEACQVFLMECSMTPHPYMLSIMSSVWNSLITVSDSPTTKHFVAAMHELLSTTAATEAAAAAAEGVFKPSSPTTQQIIHLLGVLLASVPDQMAESFCDRFVRLDSNGVGDLCHLAALSAVLRAASSSGRPAGYTTITKVISKVLESISRCVGVAINATPVQQKGRSTDGVTVQQPLPSALRLYLAWAVECLAASLEAVQPCSLANGEDSLPTSMELIVSMVVKACLILLDFPDAATAPYLPSTLHTLSLAWRLLPTVPSLSELDLLVSCMEHSLHSTPAAAAGIAELTPVLSTQSAPPKILFEALLGPSSSASLQFLGREAYVKYAKECFDENVLGALPRQWLDPSGMRLSEQGQPVMEKYLSRTCSHSTAVGPGTAVNTVLGGVKDSKFSLEIRKEVEKVARDAGTALAVMHAKAVDVSAKMVAEQQKQVINAPEIGNSSIKYAAIQVMEAVENLQKVWVPAARSSEVEQGAAGEAVRAVTQARDALTALLTKTAS